MLVFNSGCSFTTPDEFIAEQDMYWYRLAQDMSADKIINESRPASSNDLIIQRVYRHVLANPTLDTFYIVNLTSLNRIELEPKKSDQFITILTPDAIARIDFETVELTVLSQLIGLVTFLRTYKKDFYIINNSKQLSSTPWPPRDSFVKYLQSDPKILNLFNHSRFEFHKNISGVKPYDYDSLGWAGHDGADGHLAYYNHLKTLI